MEPRVSIYRRKGDGCYLVQSMCKAVPPTGLPGDFGAPVVLRPEELKNQLLVAVTEAVAKFKTQKYDENLSKHYTPTEYAQFTKGHDLVKVVALNDGSLEVQPFRHIRGGYEGMKQFTVKVAAKDIEASLLSVTEEAFKVAR